MHDSPKTRKNWRKPKLSPCQTKLNYVNLGIEKLGRTTVLNRISPEKLFPSLNKTILIPPIQRHDMTTVDFSKECKLMYLIPSIITQSKESKSE